MRKAIIMGLKEVSSKKSFGGWQKVFEHESEECKCAMKFGVFFPPQVSTFFIENMFIIIMSGCIAFLFLISVLKLKN